MIKHVVLFKFKPNSSEARFCELENRLKALPGLIPEIKSYEFGLDVMRTGRSYDFALVSAFEDIESLNRYQTHPAHVEVIGIVNELFDQIVAADFTC